MFYFYVLDSYSYPPSVCNVGIINSRMLIFTHEAI